MKTLLALVQVGYLAASVTVPVTSLPFSLPFPLAAIDCDGFVNATQYHIYSAPIKHVLASIVETGQTVTSQNNKDSALTGTKHGPGDIIEARQGEVVIPVVFIILEIAVDISLILDWIADDKSVRGNDVEFLVEHFD